MQYSTSVWETLGQNLGLNWKFSLPLSLDRNASFLDSSTLIVDFATNIVQKLILSLFHGKHSRNLLIVRNFLLDRFTIRSLLFKFDVNKTSSERQTPITLQTKQESNLLSFPWTRSKNRSWIFGDESAQREKPDLRKLWFVKWDVGVFWNWRDNKNMATMATSASSASSSSPSDTNTPSESGKSQLTGS